MGTDIHLIVEHKRNGYWQRIDPPDHYPRDPWVVNGISESKGKGDPGEMLEYYQEKYDRDWYSRRRYNLFAILADVRNGEGFGGCVTGKGYKPISKPKGFPEDCSTEKEFFGYHDFSWLSLKELLDYDWSQSTKNCGIVSWNAYLERLEKGEKGEPDAYCGWINRKVIEEDEAPGNEDPECSVRIWWDQTYSDSAGDFYSVLLPHLKEIDPDPENVRIVFGFDF